MKTCCKLDPYQASRASIMLVGGLRSNHNEVEWDAKPNIYDEPQLMSSPEILKYSPKDWTQPVNLRLASLESHFPSDIHDSSSASN